jgi:tetratricopeptide (TPR) repeat protein
VATAVVVLAGLGAARTARAEATCEVRATQEQRRREASAQFDEGQELFDAGNFAAAMATWECSFRNVPHHATLYNIARSAEMVGNLSRALDAWRGYLQMAPEAEDRVEIEARIQGLEAAVAAQNTAGSSTTTTQPAWTPPPQQNQQMATAPQTWETSQTTPTNVYNPAGQTVETRQPSPWRRYGWYIVGAGALLTIVGLVLVTPILPAASEASSAENLEPYYDPVDGACENPAAWDPIEDYDGNVIGYEQNGEVYRVIPGCWISGAVLAGTGAAAMIAGILVWALSERGGQYVVNQPRAGFTPSLAMGADGEVGGVGGTFTLRF